MEALVAVQVISSIVTKY